MFGVNLMTIGNYNWESTKEHWELKLPVAGADKKDFEVLLVNDTLYLYFDGNDYTGELERRWTVPNGVKREDITAEYSSGVLSIKIKKTTESEQKIEVT